VAGFEFEMIQREAIVMDRLSTSPRIVDIYGLRGASVLVEDMCAEITTAIVPTWAGATITDPARGFLLQEELDQLQVNGVHPLNNLTNDQKLVMAQGVAGMHGYFGIHEKWRRTSRPMGHQQPGQLKRKRRQDCSPSRTNIQLEERWPVSAPVVETGPHSESPRTHNLVLEIR
jgi:hypothetical protein